MATAAQHYSDLLKHEDSEADQRAALTASVEAINQVREWIRNGLLVYENQRRVLQKLISDALDLKSAPVSYFYDCAVFTPFPLRGKHFVSKFGPVQAENLAHKLNFREPFKSWSTSLRSTVAPSGTQQHCRLPQPRPPFDSPPILDFGSSQLDRNPVSIHHYNKTELQP